MVAQVKILIVDDSAFARFALARELESAEGIQILDHARDGFEAIEKVQRLKPDVVTLDVEMPKLNGLQTLERIMAECPTPVVMVSSLTGEGTEATIRALEAGAVDFFLKQSLANPVGDGNRASELVDKILLAAQARVARRAPEKHPEPRPVKTAKAPSSAQPAKRLVVIGSSTGGPKALYTVVPSLPGNLPAAVLLIQHMPPGFTRSLAERLNQLSQLQVKEVEDGDQLYEGKAYLARGGSHMVLGPDGSLTLTQTPPVCGVRPSVNVTMESVARNYRHSLLGVILTGMGNDGTQGAKLFKERGSRILVEDQSTCVVWGMPKSVAESGYADRNIPLHEMAAAIIQEIPVGEEKTSDRSRVYASEKQN
jgi:two-component system, chemotaxis family, protein-glutamate methylesterase/glutaminase